MTGRSSREASHHDRDPTIVSEGRRTRNDRSKSPPRTGHSGGNPTRKRSADRNSVKPTGHSGRVSDADRRSQVPTLAPAPAPDPGLDANLDNYEQKLKSEESEYKKHYTEKTRNLHPLNSPKCPHGCIQEGFEVLPLRFSGTKSLKRHIKTCPHRPR